MKPTLYILAAGMGSRYGGLKQMDGLGPNGETIMDYSIYDALRAGFGKIVFVIRKSFDKDFREKIISKYEKHVPVEVVYQELDNLPKGFTLDPERQKPWGTNHAVMMAKDVIHEPFAVINADDFYGRESYEILAKQLIQMEGQQNHYCMVGYRLHNTLSESGAVARGVCETNAEHFLSSIVERTHIERKDGKIQYKDGENYWFELPENTPVSMNMWGFTPDYFEHSDKYFVKFLEANTGNHKAEYFIPLMVDHLIINGTADVKVLDTPSKWFGVTYSEDREGVVEKLQKLVEKGEYPTPLWK
ncbi:dTDP-glucose pyrophosphorylase [Dysgonomonas sp. PFB1-18]|uniref:sugar phosphate nucleotidyltransferase n=1 Tax=unclassified Dysgonomonas TaxID=2630389 RepID=UPI002475DFDD|nr:MULTISPECIES: sugar phosphate nucleotidyltransferase [unclassified Dysgonomonas]MDH6309264.1 dTDP-glucose pyrophosphorylase [Dysgonomonas sp. PF1-14]MDH6338856.1 dTDP-glucose pyrophosphorylase [Dysgonomonas sp. PF1-16]MDH6380513.1 dTDP-glucose pyrophosphorylase [Dysgonomonas sp. PFB1-18]MDH6397684.1 dTDP-glucose pyrophosphorylase [Dysgonomonas sp. PF1-23]